MRSHIFELVDLNPKNYDKKYVRQTDEETEILRIKLVVIFKFGTKIVVENEYGERICV